MFEHGRLAGRLLAAAALAAVLFVPAAAYADEAVSFGAGDVEAGEQVYLGTWENEPIVWDVESASGTSIAVHAHHVLFNSRIDDAFFVSDNPKLTLEASQLYTQEGWHDSSGVWSLPDFRAAAFVGAERALTGAFALSGDFGVATKPSGDGDWYWINEPLEQYMRSGDITWRGTLVRKEGYRDKTSVRRDNIGVRPASSFSLNSVIFTSAAEDGKSGIAGAGDFAALTSASSVSAWKFTLLDSSRAVTASATGTTTQAGYASWTVPVTFSDGGTSSNEYVSAILCDGDGNAIYYGTVAASTASGTQEMSMPAGLAVGTYTMKVFSEQRNGEKRTDYAGPTVDIELTVAALPVEYTIAVSASPEDGGTVSGGKTYTEGESVTLIATPATGYDFVNWTEGGEAIPDAGATYTFDAVADRTLVANFELQSFTVKFVDWDGIELQSGNVAYGEVPEYEGSGPTRKADADNTYKFSGWTPAIAAVTGEATYTATYEATPIPKGTLTFDLAGGTLDGKTGTVTIKANIGDTIKLPTAPTRDGYTFKCWKGSEYAAGADYKVEGDHAFTAVWEKVASSSPAKHGIPATGDPLIDMLLPLMALVAASGLCLAVAGIALGKRRSRAYSGKHAKR